MIPMSPTLAAEHVFEDGYGYRISGPIHRRLLIFVDPQGEEYSFPYMTESEVTHFLEPSAHHLVAINKLAQAVAGGLKPKRFRWLNSLNKKEFPFAESIEDPLTFMAYFSISFPRKLTQDEKLYIAKIAALSATELIGELPYTTANAVRGLPMSDWFAMVDFIQRGDLKQTFPEFMRFYKQEPYALPFKYYKSRGRYSTMVIRPGELNATEESVRAVAHRYLQLSRRSQKLAKKLNGLTLERIYNALRFDIPGTLLVTDTIELVDSLKYARIPGPGYEFFPPVKQILGTTLYNQIEKAGLVKEYNELLRSNEAFIKDDEVIFSHVPFIIHAVRKLGAELTLETINLLHRETEGVTMRGFMGLIRQGGFSNKQPAALEVWLLP